MNLSSIKRGIFAIGHAPRRAPGGSESASTIARIIRELETLNGSTERDFLAVGEKLVEFRSAARQIASDMANVIELISGEQGRDASQALIKILQQSKEIDARIERSGQALATVRDLANQLRRAFSGLPNMVSVFRTLCTLTRIETSRLGATGTDLAHLAAEIRPLSESIQTGGERVLEASQRLDHRVQCAIRNGAELRAAQLQQMPALVAGVRDSLESFEQRRQLSVESSNQQATQFAAVWAAINDLVGSIQFHDITRQQVEHVAAALREFLSGCKGRHGALDSRAGGRAILALQSSQLAEAARTFAQSVERIDRDLESIAGRLSNASEAVRTLMGISGDDHDSFFEKMEGQFSAILNMLGACTAAQAEMDFTTAGLGETIGHMRDAVTEIRGTEIRIQRISTNATIGATHLGATGVALNTIAEAMQRLALDSNSNTENAATTLDAMSEAAGRASASSEDRPATGSTADHVTGEMRRALRELHSSSESSLRRVNHIAQLGARLAQDIGAVHGGFSAGRAFADVIDRVRGELEGLGAQAGAPQPGDLASQHQLAHFAKTYTMQSQHDVHESVVTGVAIPRTTAAAVHNAAPAEGDLGDNVDLF